MKNASVIEAVKFGFKSLFKKPLFFIGTYLVTIGVGFAGILLGILIAIPFVFPLIRMLARLKIEFMGVFGQALSKAMMLNATLPEAVTQGPGPMPQMGAMQLKDFIVDMIRGTFGIFLRHPGVFLMLGLAVLIVFCTIIAIQFYVYAGWARISLAFYDKGSSTIGTFFSGFSTLIKLIVAGFIYSFLVILPWKLAAGLFIIYPNVILLLVWIPLAIFFSMFFLLKFFYFVFFIVDKNAGIFESLGNAFRLKGAPSRLILLWLLFFAASILFSLTVGWLFALIKMPAIIGSLVSLIYNFVIMVVGVMSLGYLYKRLSAF